jgi:hypothetical protein
MIVNPDSVEWLEHRAGLARSETAAVARLQWALELGREGRTQIDAFGRQDIRAFAGLVRLRGVAERTVGWTPGRIHEYLTRFLAPVLEMASAGAALAEKRLGDEVSFVWPDTAEDNGVKADRMVGLMLRDLCALQERLGAEYPLTVSLVYGNLYLGHMAGSAFGDWMVSGEPLHLARGLSELEELRDLPGMACVFGVLEREQALAPPASTLMALCGRWLSPRVVEDPPPIPGVSPARYAFLKPIL